MWQTVKVLLISGGMITGLLFGCGERPGEKEFENGVRQFERQRLVRAKDLFEKSINKRPGDAANAYAYHYLGCITWALDDRATAVAYFENSRQVNPQLFEPVYSLGVAAFTEGDWVRARAHFMAASQLNPQDPRPLEYLARTYRGEESRRDAQRMLLNALARSPQSARILTSLAMLEYEEAGPTAAVARLMEALETNPQYPPALFNLGRIHEGWPEQEEHAKAFFEQFLLVAPADAPREQAERAVARLGPASHGADAARHEPGGSRIDAVADGALEPKAEGATAPSVPVSPKTPDEVLAEARQLAAAGQQEQALGLCMRVAVQAGQRAEFGLEERALREALAIAPDSARLHVALGRNRLAQQRSRDALASFQRAVALDDASVPAWVGLAQSARALADYDVALNALNRAVALAPGDPDPLWSLASLHDETGVRRRAAAAYRQFQQQFAADPRAAQAGVRLSELDPPPVPPPTTRPESAPAARSRNVEAAQEAFRRAASYQERGDWANALFYYERAIDQNPDMEQAHYNMGVLNLERREFRSAQEAFARSVELAPNKVVALYNLALAQYELGDTAAAVPLLEQVLRLNPDYARAHLLLGLVHADDPSAQDRAIRHYRRFLELRPDDPNAAAIRLWLTGRRENR